jgi:hypothetical protein
LDSWNSLSRARKRVGERVVDFELEKIKVKNALSLPLPLAEEGAKPITITLPRHFNSLG